MAAPKSNGFGVGLWNSRVLLLVSWLALCVAFALVSRDLLPERYSYDGRFIEAIAQGRPYVVPDRSYENTAAFYAALGLAHAPEIVSLLGPITMGVAVILLLSRKQLGVSVPMLFLGALAIALAAVYMSWYSKDFIALIGVSVVALLLQRRVNELIVVLPLAIYAILFREHWMIVVAVFIVLTALDRFRPLTGRAIILVVIMLVAVLELFYSATAGESLSEVRLGLNENRVGAPDAASMITQAIPGSGAVSSIANTLIAMVSLIVPVPLLLTRSTLHALSAALIVLIWALIFRARRGHQREIEGRMPRSPQRMAFLMLIAFLVLFAVAEPDYGSYLRHFSSVMPIAIVAVSHELGHDRVHQTSDSSAAPSLV